MRIEENILRFEKHLNGAKSLKNKNLSDYLIYNTLAMECFQSANALIDIAEAVVMKKRLGFPSTYSEVFEILSKNRIINKEDLREAKSVVFLRNLIAYEYCSIKEKDLKNMVDFLDKMRNFVNKVKTMVKEEKS
ncbi:MAG: HepT-like ribonuclease domain-containing protein [candidate division WOR-3 bacterium]